MKFRKIISRIALVKAENFECGVLYRPVKFDKTIILEDDFWFNTFAWKQEKVENFGFVQLKQGHIMAAKNDILFQSVRFGNEYLFIKVSEPVNISCIKCCHRSISFEKFFKV
jgi:hypothetical protein